MDIKYEIIEEIGVLSENAKGWRKGVTLTAAEVEELKKLL